MAALAATLAFVGFVVLANRVMVPLLALWSVHLRLVFWVVGDVCNARTRVGGAVR